MRKKILILGGYGNLGYLISSYLAKPDYEIEIILGGRNKEKAMQFSDRIKMETGNKRIKGIYVDATNSTSLEEAMMEVDLVVVASSTIKHVKKVVEAAIRTNTDYLDTQLSSDFKLSYLKEKEEKIIKSGRIFITDGGFHPGLLAAIPRWADLKVGTLYSANIYGALKVNWSRLLVNKETVEEMIDEFKIFDTSVLKDGEWVKAGYSESITYDFGEPFFQQGCISMCIEELKMLSAQFPNLKDAGFFITGFNKILDYVLFPVIMLCANVLPERMKFIPAAIFRWGLKFSKPPFGVRLIAECKGIKGELKIRFSDSDGYKLTAIPIVACIKQYLEGFITKPGLYWQAWVVEPLRFFQDMEEMGLDIQTELPDYSFSGTS